MICLELEVVVWEKNGTPKNNLKHVTEEIILFMIEENAHGCENNQS